MQQEKFTLVSNADGLILHGLLVAPDNDIQGVIQILHGMCEFKERYQEFMEFFCAHGFAVVCHDQRGHGDSLREECDLGYFYETKAQAIVQDAAQVTEWIKQRYPDLPITLFGHSMGSMVARCYLQEHDTLVDKAIICGSPAKNPLVNIAIGLTKTIALFRGERHRCKTLSYLSTGKGNKQFPGEDKGAWLSKNRANITAFYSNPKGNKRFTCNGFENLFRLMKKTYSPKLYKVQNPTLPIHFVSGSEDSVLGGAKNFDKAIAFMQNVGYTNVSGKLYQGLRHEIHNEIENAGVLSDLLAQMQTK